MMNQSLLKGLVILLSINQIHGGIKLNKLKWRLSNRFYWNTNPLYFHL